MKRSAVGTAGETILQDGKVRYIPRPKELRLVERNAKPEGPPQLEGKDQKQQQEDGVKVTQGQLLEHGRRKKEQLPASSVEQDAMVLREADAEDLRAASSSLRDGEVFGMELPSLEDYKEEVLSIRDINERASAAARSESQLRLVRYRRRFQWFGDVWVAVLQYMKWRSSLRFCFEVPLLFASSRSNNPYLVRKSEYVAALMSALSIRTSPVPLPQLGRILEDSFDVLNSEGGVRIDRREALCFWQFFRMKADAGPGEVIRMLFRSFDGDMGVGLSHVDFMKMLVQLCVSRSESQDILGAVSPTSFERVLKGSHGAAGVQLEAGRGQTAVGGGGSQLSTPASSPHRSDARRQLKASTPRIDSAKLERIIDTSPELLRVFEGIRRKRLPAALRSMVQRARLNKQLDKTQRQMNEVNYRMKIRHAIRFWQEQTTRRWFTEWRVAVATIQQHRLVEYRHKCRRALRTWLKWARSSGVRRKQNRVARLYYGVCLTRRALQALHTHVSSIRRYRNLLTDRAVLSYNSHIFERYFYAWKEDYLSGIAYRKFSAIVRRRCIRALRRYVDQQRLVGKSRKQLRMQKQGEIQAEADRRARIRIKATRDAETRHDIMEQEAFSAEVESHRRTTQEVARIEEAEAARRRAYVLERQAESRAVYARKVRLEAVRSFNAKWKGGVERAETEARQREETWLDSAEGVAWVEEERKVFQGHKDAQKLSQRGSVYSIVAKPPLGRLWAQNTETGEEFRCGPMTRENAIKVLRAHRLAEVCIKAREEAAAKEKKAWYLLHKEQVARSLQRVFRSSRLRHVILDRYRAVLEQVVDPYSGKVQYVHLVTGEVRDRKPLLFRSSPVHPDPEWALRYDMVRSRHYYLNVAKPELTETHPPKGYLLCFQCRLDFATRRCYGEGCNGFAFCFGCWREAHPDEDGVLSAHALQVERVSVKRCTCQMKAYCESMGVADMAVCGAHAQQPEAPASGAGAAANSDTGSAQFADGILWDPTSWYRVLCKGCATKWTEGQIRSAVMQPATCALQLVPGDLAPQANAGGALLHGSQSPADAVGATEASTQPWDFYEFIGPELVRQAIQRQARSRDL